VSWLEVSLTVNGELAEAVADVLARFAPNGVTTEQSVAFTSDEDEGTPMGPITVRGYVPVDERLDETRRRLEQALHYLGMIEKIPPAAYREIPDQNWMEAWKENYHPIPIGKKLIIVPAWLDSPDKKRIPIKIDPGMAFGTGTHPTTQLCLEMIEEALTRLSPEDLRSSHVIDVGCGSGILSIAALKMGAAHALGVDIDPASVQASRENASANDIPEEKFDLGLGSVGEVLAGTFGLRSAALVLANILAPTIIHLFDQGLGDIVEERGSLILSGILQEQTQSVVDALESHGMHLTGKRQMDDWVALKCKHVYS
jgi:ribosomal protein L11 methyltransferase